MGAFVVVCPSCDTENKRGAKFCVECGTSLTLRCRSCDTPHTAVQKFCAECGAALTTPAPVPSTPSEPAELRLVSVLFVDLVGFTPLSESRDAEDVRELLGRYFTLSRTIVARYGGEVAKFAGDAVMAVWGAPVAREDDAERAVRAALEIVDAVAVFGESVGAPGLRARAGVVTGRVAALSNPEEGLVVGDRVNTASRIQAAADPGGVLVDPITRQVTAAAIAYEDAGEHLVRGKTQPLHLWRAARVVAGVGGRERQSGLVAPFIGRDGELRLLKELFHSAVERRAARLIAVSGPAGVGKSRLRREFSNYTDGLADSFLWHSGRCPSYGEGMAYRALSEMVRQRLGIAEDAHAAEVMHKLADGLDRWVPEATDRAFLAPRLGALLGVAEPGLDREDLFAGWRLFFEQLSAHDPVVMVFEDLQWADDGLLDFIEQLLDWSAGHPIFMLTLARPDLATRHQGWPAGRRGASLLSLEPLDDEHMHTLLDVLVDGLPRGAAGRIVHRAEGIPLYAIETLRALTDRGVLREDAGRLSLVGELGELDVPASLSSLLAARLDALEPEERRLVKSLSVFGGAFPRSAAVALGDISPDRVDGVLSALVTKQILMTRADRLSPDRGRYAFAQGMLRTVAYELLARRDRKHGHLAAAAHLERAYPDDGEEMAEAIASHYLDAFRAARSDSDADELRRRTVLALRRAAGRAATVGALDSAERFYLTAAEMTDSELERAELTRAGGEVALTRGAISTGLTLLEQAAADHRAAGRTEELARLQASIGRGLNRSGRNDESIERSRAALAELGAERADADVGALNRLLGEALMFSGRINEAGPPLERALAIAQQLQLPQLHMQTLNNQGSICKRTGQVLEASRLYGEAIELARRHDLMQPLAAALGNKGDLCMQWDLPGAPDLAHSALAVARRHGERHTMGVQAANLILAYLFAGRWDEAEHVALTMLEGRTPEEAAYLHYRLAWLYALRGEVDRAQESLGQLAAWEQSGSTELQTAHASAAVSVHQAAGRSSLALKLGSERLRSAMETLGASNETVRQAWPDTFAAALALGRLPDARALLALLSDPPSERMPPYLRAHLARGRALLAAAEGHHELVEVDLADALTQLRRLGYPYWIARTENDLATWLTAQHRADEATALRAAARVTFRELRVTPAASAGGVRAPLSR